MQERNDALSDIRITREDSDTKGRFVGVIDGVVGEAELTFSKVSPTLIIADHTAAPDSMRGMGAARALVDHLIETARREGFRIVPLCPYVRAQYAKHPEWSDVMQS